MGREGAGASKGSVRERAWRVGGGVAREVEERGRGRKERRGEENTKDRRKRRKQGVLSA